MKTTLRIPMTAERWQAVTPNPGDDKTEVRFFGHEGLPEGAMELKSGTIALNGLEFGNGTIEFDMKALGQDIPGIQFRRQGPVEKENAEEFYIRTFPECRASNDCIQYTPVLNGFMLWNFYPQYQTHAFILEGWNHVKLVVSGARMKVYINGFADPALTVGKLERSSTHGSIALRGPAVFANLMVSADVVEGLAPQASPDPTASDTRYVRQWQVAPLARFNEGKALSYAEMPAAPLAWQSVTAGRFGMVNLNRAFALNLEQPRPLTWLRCTVRSDRTQIKHVSMGWLGAAWVFVDGTLATQGKNYYEPEAEPRSPDGRLSIDNGSFDIPLRQGDNEIVVAVLTSTHDDPGAHNRYGWGLGMRFDDLVGIQVQRPASPIH